MNNMKKPKITIICGSDSDLEIMKDCFIILEEFNIKYTIEILSAHRTPELLTDFISKAEKNGFELIIAAAGMAAHLPGVIASYTTMPVIGVPLKSKTLEGLDALFSIVQMPPGIPVATVGINNTKNAALLAISILSLKYPELKNSLKKLRLQTKKNLIDKNEILKKQGWRKYIKNNTLK